MQEITTADKLYLDAPELSAMLGVSIGHSYKIIRELNSELKAKGYIVISGKVPTAYFKTKYFGFDEH